MYYPKSQITTDLYTSGGELLLRNSSYSGYYYQTSDGRYFSNKSPDDIPTYELFPINDNTNATSSLSPIVPTNNPIPIEGVDYAHHIGLSPPSFESHRRP